MELVPEEGEEERKEVKAEFDYVMGPFHKDEITGLDVCIRKELIATCSKDRSVAIWNYATRSHELSHTWQEECLAVAFHPSGLHLIVAFGDKISVCNILSNKIWPFKTITLKMCSEIKFASGGHLFACAAKNEVLVYNFYTVDSPPHMLFTGHLNRVSSIDWFENDLGFTTCGQDGNIYFYDDLYQIGEKSGLRNMNMDKNRKDVRFSCVVNIPGKPYQFLAVGNEQTIYTECEQIKVPPRPTIDGAQRPPELPQIDRQISQLAFHNAGKVFFAGIGDTTQVRPGAIQIWKMPLEKFYEVQAHSKPVSRMRITSNNTHLFSTGLDNLLCVFEIKDRDPKNQDNQAPLGFSEEILTEKIQLESL